MDLNELLHAHQVAVMQASASGDDDTRQNHFDQVALYAQRIRDLRDFRQQTDPPAGTERQATIVYGTYAGDPQPHAQTISINAWESEGGAIDRPDLPPPPGLILKMVPQYSVGPYVCSDLALACAEHARQNPVEQDTMGQSAR